jgi:3-carboxy-cis,cis-muconate cycloisomerase
MSLYSEFFYANEVNEIFSDRNSVAYLLKVEAALAASQAQCGIISSENAAIIESCCQVELIDVSKLKKEIKLGGNIAIPLVQQLNKVVKNIHFEASKYVHYGATSQDIIDTATVLQMQEFNVWLEQKIEFLISELVKLTKKHAKTVMIGRTLLQHAKPITFGLKTGAWLAAISRSQERIAESKKRLFVVQMAGAVGIGNDFLTFDVIDKVAEILNLKPSFSWQSNRDNFNEYASKLGILTGSIGKLAKDISLLMQTEVAEVFEGAAAGKGGSSTMPHKRNPVTCSAIIANANNVPHLVASLLSSMAQEHERSAGLWHAEWEVLTQIMMLTGGIVEKAIDLISNLEVDEKRMLANLEITNGLIYAENIALALTPKLGKINAHELVEKACKLAISKEKHLKEILLELKIDVPNLDELFKPENSIGNSLAVVDLLIG